LIDLHLHILPGIDDGAPNLDESRKMLKRLADTGYTRVVATPHLASPLTLDYEMRVNRAFDGLRPMAEEFGIELDLGYEHMISSDLAHRLETGERSTLAGSRAVLVELPFTEWPHHADSSLFALQIAGFIPILAHVERYSDVQRDKNLALAAADRGVVLQLTLASFVGVFGSRAQRTARILLRETLTRGTPVILATDAHSTGQRLAQIESSLSWIRNHVTHGDDAIHWAARALPEALVSSAALPEFTMGPPIVSVPDRIVDKAQRMWAKVIRRS